MSEIANIQKAEIRKSSKSYLFVGGFGSGKTLLAIKNPGKRKLILDIDCKLHEMEQLTPVDLEGIDVWTHQELLLPGGIQTPVVDPTRKDPKKGFVGGPKPKGFERQLTFTNELLTLAEKNEYPYNCTIWDSGTRTVEHLIQLILWTHGYGSMNETLWGVFGQAFLNYLQGFLRLPGDRIVIFHERHIQKRDREGNITMDKIFPSCPGQQGLNIGSFFSESYYFSGRNLTTGKYFIQTGSDEKVNARTAKGLEFKQEIDPGKIYG